tara:strand:- start:1239 stop:2087 length:849 start_codon:yes stop_codon:yes gene_type:complete
MVNDRFGLGRGVDALFSKMDSSFFAKLNIEQITANPFQPRTNFNNSELKELAESISQYGIIQPLTVRKLDDKKYQIISGERRYLASKMAGLKTVPVYIKKAKDNEMLELALIENIQREDLDPIEIGISYKTLIDELQITQEELSKKIGKKRSTISNYIRLLQLHPIIQAGLRDFILTIGHAKPLLSLSNQGKQLELYNYMVSNSLSVRETEDLVKLNKNNVHFEKRTYNNNLSIELKSMQDNLADFFEAEVKIKALRSGKRKIEIQFNSEKKLHEFIKNIQN